VVFLFHIGIIILSGEKINRGLTDINKFAIIIAVLIKSAKRKKEGE